MRKSILHYFCCFVAELIFLIAAVACGFSIKHEIEFQAAIDGGVIVNAEIVRISNVGAGGNHISTSYDTIYKYVDEFGVVYTGRAELDLRYDEARAKIGTTTQIYIGENGVNIRVGYEPSLAEAIILADCVFAPVYRGKYGTPCLEATQPKKRNIKNVTEQNRK